jgi:hypothetical protein
MSLQSGDPLFDHFDSDQHRLWKQDRLLRQRVPLRQTWRGCLGLAALFHAVEHTEYPTDAHALVPNRTITWLALRDIPPGHFPSVRAMNRRDVQYVNTATATLRHGMPVIDFTQNVREAWDLRFMPFGTYERSVDGYGSETFCGRGDVLNCDERPREFAVLNRLSAAMTRFAICAADSHGRPLRRPWSALRHQDQTALLPSLPAQWMPRPYLSFPARYAPYLRQHAGVKELRVEGEQGSVLFPAGRVFRLISEVRPLALWWDFQACSRFVDGQLEAAVFPPLHLRWWDRLRFGLPGDVLLDASVADPRFRARARRAQIELPPGSDAPEPAPTPGLVMHRLSEATTLIEATDLPRALAG